MSLKKSAITAGLAGVAFLLASGGAFAAAAYATSTVNVRSGPGTDYPVVDTLRSGESVDVERCRGSWCFVEKSGPDGWVSASYLGRDGYDDEDDYYDDEPEIYIAPPPPRYYRPWRGPRHGGWYNYSEVCTGGRNVQFCVSD